MKTVNDLMTKEVISVHPETPLIEAANTLLKYSFSGLPVIDENNVLVGIITDYDLIIKGSSVHLPTFIKLLSQLDIYKKDQGLIKDDLKKIFEMKVKDVMNPDPFVLLDNAPIEEAFAAFREHHKINPILVVDREKKIIGVLSRYDLNKLFRSPSPFLEGVSNKERDIDRDINLFIDGFGKQFIFVSKFRTHSWLFVSILFAVIGYLVAWFWILRFV